MTPWEAEEALQRMEIWNWLTFLAAIIFGIALGANAMIHWWNYQAKRMRPKPDPIRLAHRGGYLSGPAPATIPKPPTSAGPGWVRPQPQRMVLQALENHVQVRHPGTGAWITLHKGDTWSEWRPPTSDAVREANEQAITEEMRLGLQIRRGQRDRYQEFSVKPVED